MPDSIPRPSTVYTFRDFPHLEVGCRGCDATTLIESGAITGGCPHIIVVWCEDGDA